jgi:hypothetical protein
MPILCRSESYCKKTPFVSHNCSRFDHGTGFLQSVGLLLWTRIDRIGVPFIGQRRKRKRLNCGFRLDPAATSCRRRDSSGRPLHGRSPYCYCTDLSSRQSNVTPGSPRGLSSGGSVLLCQNPNAGSGGKRGHEDAGSTPFAGGECLFELDDLACPRCGLHQKVTVTRRST